MALEYVSAIVDRSLTDVESYLARSSLHARRDDPDYHDILNYKLHKLSLDWQKLVRSDDDEGDSNNKAKKDRLTKRYDNARKQAYGELDRARRVSQRDFERVLFNEDDEDGDENVTIESKLEFQRVLKQFMVSKVKGTIHEVKQHLETSGDDCSAMKRKYERFQEIPSLIKDLKCRKTYAEPLSDEARKLLWDSYDEVDRRVRDCRRGGTVLPQRFRRVLVTANRFKPY